MELKIVKEDEKTLFIETSGETYTLTNTLREELWNDKSVSEAADVKEHPYIAQPKIFLRVYKGSPRTVLEKAAERVSEKAKEFKEEFKRALKG